MILTAAEIRDLAVMVGFTVDTHDVDMGYDVTVEGCPKEGIKFEDGTVHYFRHIACDSEYPEEGYHMLGDEIEYDE